MVGDSRGGGYDKARDEEAYGKKKKALSSESRQSVGAQILARSPGTAPEAPTSIGQLMTPSAGRGMPPSSPEEFNEQVGRNKTFLSNPDTQAAILQFGVSLMSSGNPGHAMASALGAPARMRTAQAKIQHQAFEDELSIRRLQNEEERLGIAKTEFGQEQDKIANRKAIFGALKNMTDDQLMQTATELAANGDDEGARIALSMSKSLGGSDAATALMKNYNLAVAQGFKGSLMEYQQASFKSGIVEAIRVKIAGGIPLTPGEKQVYDDAIKADPLMRFLQSQGFDTAPAGGATVNDEGPATKADVDFMVEKYPQFTRQQILDQLGIEEPTE